MKTKKYLLFLLLIMIINVKPIFALTLNDSDRFKFLDNTNILTTSKNVTALNTMFLAKNNNDSGVNISCDGIFGSKNDPNSLRYLINEILMYPKIIVPALVIGFGTLDFAKAVIASREDDMKKAQKTFVKRVIIGITIYFVPLIMNIIMYLADAAWNGSFTTCGL